MPTAAPRPDTAEPPATRRLARAIAGLRAEDVPAGVRDKARGCLADFVGCVLESADLPWSRSALAYARLQPPGPAGVIGTGLRLGATEAAFANGTLGHGLVREDMHVASCSHLGVVVWPALLALAEQEGDKGGDLLLAGIAGYEAGAQVGRALFDADLAARIRPTGTIGAIAAAAAGARFLGLSEDRTLAALSLAANMAGGLNEWPWAGGTEMVVHAGTAARAGVTAVLLAREGMEPSPSALEGRAGLFAAYGRRDRAERIAPFAEGHFEITEVYWKPSPACNYVQTPCQVAARLATRLAEAGLGAEAVESLRIDSFPHAVDYPGCDFAGPFSAVLEAKMSLQYSVAAVLVTGEIAEANYRMLDDPGIARLAGATTLALDDGFIAAYPGKQGARVTLTLRDGQEMAEEMADVDSVDLAGVLARLDAIATATLGAQGAAEIAAALEELDRPDAAATLVAATVPANSG
ncbi:MmgE/PrpD family protein [Aquicoccus sp. SCR17]|nr:MmgE/PrpD family protein [Carideicomes alvinocaridis]